jgi:predicted kinase
MNQKLLVLFRGLPGSGKTMLAKRFCSVSIAADDFVEGEWDVTKLKEYHAACRERTEFFMERGVHTIGVHNTFTQEWEMQAYFDLAQTWGYLVSTVVVENRHGCVNEHDVPASTLRKMNERFDVVLIPDEQLVEPPPPTLSPRVACGTTRCWSWDSY